jgi:hypothetical protein
MKFESEVAPRLSAGELKAIETLKASGWAVIISAKLDSAFSETGDRYRSFSLSGRYPVAVALRKLEDVEQRIVPEVEPAALVPAPGIVEPVALPVFFEPEDAIEPEAAVKVKIRRKRGK